MTIYEIVKKLIGNIEPYGDTDIDEERKDNLKEHEILTYGLIRDLIETAKLKDRPEYSIHELGHDAYNILWEIKETIDNEIDN